MQGANTWAVVLTVLIACLKLQLSLAEVEDIKWCTKSFETNVTYEEDTADVMWFFSDFNAQYQMVKLANFSNTVHKGTAENDNAVLGISTTQLGKEFYGVGASLPQSTAWLLLKLKKKACDRYWKMLHNWFGCNSYDHSSCFNMLSVPISANAYNVGPLWTYDDASNDTFFNELTLFEHAKDQIWVLKDIVQVNPHVKLVAVPYTAPLAYKTLAEGHPWSSWFTGYLKEGMEEQYAKYLAIVLDRFVSMSIAEVVGKDKLGENIVEQRPANINFFAVSLQSNPNEDGDGDAKESAGSDVTSNTTTTTDSAPPIDMSTPRMFMTIEQQVKLAGFLRENLDKTLAKGIKILGFDDDWASWKEAEALGKKDAMQNKRKVIGLHPAGEKDPAGVIDMYGFHCYKGGPTQMKDLAESIGDEYTYVITQCSGFGPSNVAQNLPWNVNNLYVGGTANGAQSIMHGVLVLDMDGGPAISDTTPTRPLQTIDRKFKSTHKNEENIGLTHWGKNLRPGARVASSKMDGGWGCINGMAFLNSDGSFVVPVANWCTAQQELSIEFDEALHWDVTAPIGVHTFVFKAGAVPVMRSSSSSEKAGFSNGNPLFLTIGIMVVMLPALAIVIRMYRNAVPVKEGRRSRQRYGLDVNDVKNAELLPIKGEAYPDVGSC